MKKDPVRVLAAHLSTAIATLPDSHTLEDVFNILAAHKKWKSDLGWAFQMLDAQRVRFADSQVWHPRLRQFRNHPYWFSQFHQLIASDE